MEMEERTIGNVIILDMKGKLLIGEGGEILRPKINTLIENKQTNILLNLAEISYVDSAGLGEIIYSMRTLKHENGQLKLLRPSERIRTLLTITQLIKVFEIYEDEEEALKSF
jgi:anti-sigma B factor antagonist